MPSDGGSDPTNDSVDMMLYAAFRAFDDLATTGAAVGSRYSGERIGRGEAFDMRFRHWDVRYEGVGDIWRKRPPLSPKERWGLELRLLRPSQSSTMVS